MTPTTLHLRSETKHLERRSACESQVLMLHPPSTRTYLKKVTPTTTKALIETGYKINVERSASRMFSDEEFVAAGATLVAEGSWPEAPIDNIIVGLKVLPKDNCVCTLSTLEPG